jgi:polysaccharide pyruvyl transferase WcaK-like protein
MMPRTLGFMSVKTQFDNLGDALINKELAALVAARVPLTIDLTRSPKSFHATMGVEQLSNTRLITSGRGRMLLDMAKQAIAGNRCYFFLNPGGLGGGVGDNTRAFVSSLVYNCILLALRCLGVRVCLVGVSFEPMTWRERLVTRMRRRICHAFVVRDEVSARYLERIGIPADDVVPDLSFNLYQQPATEATSKQIASAFSFRTDRGLSTARLAEWAERIIAEGASDSHHAVISQVGRDSRGMRELHSRLCKRFGEERISLIETDSSLETACHWYSMTERVYSNRLHVLLLAANAGARPVAVLPGGNHGKVSALFADLGLSTNVVDMQGGTIESAHDLSWAQGLAERERLDSYFDRLLLERVSQPTASHGNASHA